MNSLVRKHLRQGRFPPRHGLITRRCRFNALAEKKKGERVGSSSGGDLCQNVHFEFLLSRYGGGFFFG
jgi:hypothetical protein